MPIQKLAEAKKRFGDAEIAFRTLCEVEKSPELGPGEEEFRSALISFVAVAQSCVSMAGLNQSSVNAVIAKWSKTDHDMFLWFRAARNQSLKQGESILKTRVVQVPAGELKAKRSRSHGRNPSVGEKSPRLVGATRATVDVNVFELDVEGIIRPAVRTCQEYLELLRRFLQDPAVFGPTW